MPPTDDVVSGRRGFAQPLTEVQFRINIADRASLTARR